jgi:hypothetical protein
MSSRSEQVRAQARAILEQRTPIANDTTLRSLQEQVASIVSEAKRQDPSGTDEVMSTVINEIARAYFRHARRRR